MSQILSFTFALLVLVASMGFTINKHYCGGELRKVALNKKIELCPMCKKLEEQKPMCHKEVPPHKKGCCENHQDKVQTSDYSLVKKVEQNNISDFHFIAFSYVILANIHADDIDSNSFYHEYSPPLIDHDIPIEVQSFLL